MQQGYSDPDALNSDENLTALHGDARFAKAVEQAKKNQRPCAYSTENRQFDFWVGDWDVRPTGQPAVGPPARNTVTLDDNECVVTDTIAGPQKFYRLRKK